MVLPARESPPRPLKHIIVVWLVLLAVMAGAFTAIVFALNSTLYSAGGFVGSYLSALQRHDLDGALATPGVLGTAGASTDLLTPDALGGLDDIRQQSDTDLGDGLHLVTYEYSFAGTTEHSTFQVQYTGTRLGLFSDWAFMESPVSVLQILPLHDAVFEVNGVTITSDSGPSVAKSFQVLTPGFFTLTHKSAYLEAEPVHAVVTRGSTVMPVTIDIQANDKFVSSIQRQVDDFLDECATQQVLFPTGCPFGQELANRVESAPEWSMAQYPEVAIEPGDEPGSWVVPEAPGSAHLTVEVRSLFDGTLSTFDEDVPFALSWILTFDGNKVNVQAQ